MNSYDPIKFIKECTDKDHLLKMLNIYIPIDIENVHEEANDIVAKLMKLSIEEYKNRRLDDLNKIKSAVEERLRELNK